MLHLPALPAERPLRLPTGLLWEARVRWRMARRRHPIRRWHLAAVVMVALSLWVGTGLLSGWRENVRLERQAGRLAVQDRVLAALVAREGAELQAAAAPGWAAEQARAEGLANPSQAVYVITPARPGPAA